MEYHPHMLKSLDILTSALNEEDCIQELYSQLNQVMLHNPNWSWRLIICDNGSKDLTWNKINNLCRVNSNVIGIRMSRTFELDEAFACAIDYSDADAAVIMTSDLQDPPELISQFLELYEQGFEQVMVRITSRNEVPPLRRFLSKTYYRIAKRLTNNAILSGVSDYRFLTRNVVLALKEMKERQRFFRGLANIAGFKATIIETERAPRFAGESKFMKAKLTRLTSFAARSNLNHTTATLELKSAIGTLASLLSSASTLIIAII